jgi:hypothetical protein
MTAVPAYPVRVDASLGAQLSRWRWLVKWVLAIQGSAGTVAATLTRTPTGLTAGVIFVAGATALIAIPIRRSRRDLE